MWDCHFWWWVRALIFSLHRNLSPLFAAPCCQFSPSSGVVALGFAVVFNNEQVSCLFRPWFYNHFTRVNAAGLRNPLGSVVLWGTPQWEWKCDWLIYGGREHTKQTLFSLRFVMKLLLFQEYLKLFLFPLCLWVQMKEGASWLPLRNVAASCPASHEAFGRARWAVAVCSWKWKWQV